jgi:uncharacterized protein YlxW (UPF0749 family)
VQTCDVPIFLVWHLQSVGDKQAEIRQREEGIARCDAENTELNTKRNELQNKLKELQRTEASVKR